MFIWSRNFQSGVTMNILMTSCGCSRLWASCKVGIREESGTSLYGGWAKKGERLERSRREEQTAERREVLGLSSFLGNYNRATYRATAGPLLSLSLSLSLHLSFSVSSTFRPTRSNVPCLYGTLISFYGNCVYGTTRELQVFVISWNCEALVAFFKGRPWIVFLFDESFTTVFVFCQEAEYPWSWSVLSRTRCLQAMPGNLVEIYDN